MPQTLQNVSGCVWTPCKLLLQGWSRSMANRGVWGSERGQAGAGEIPGYLYKDFCLFTVNYRLYESVCSHTQIIISKWDKIIVIFPIFECLAFFKYQSIVHFFQKHVSRARVYIRLRARQLHPECPRQSVNSASAAWVLWVVGQWLCMEDWNH